MRTGSLCSRSAMPRIRTLKPEAPQHRKIGRLSIHARWLWVVMITQADDQGRLVADAQQLRLWAFGYDLEVTNEAVDLWLEEVAKTGLVRLYTVKHVRYCVFDSWRDHQRIDRPTPSKLPDPPVLRSTSARRVLAEPSTNAREGSERIGRIRSEGSNQKLDALSVDSGKPNNGHSPDQWPLEREARKQAMLDALRKQIPQPPPDAF